MTEPLTELFFRSNLLADDPEKIYAAVSSTGFFNPEEIAIAAELAEETLIQGTESGYDFLIAELERNFAGYCCFGRIPCTINSYDLYWIVVDPSFQRRGIGRLLLAETESVIKTKGGCRIFIETSSKPRYNPTRKFYLRSGYIEEALLNDFYGPDDHKLIYSKYI